jgi:uncharacterized protein
MEINVAQLLKSPIGTTRQYEVSEIVDCGNGGYPVEGGIKLTRTNRSVLAEGTMRTEVKVTCSRCLRLFTCPLTLNIVEEYFPTIDVLSGNPLPSPEEPGAFTVDEHHILDLTEAICQYTSMATPMKPLCREDCAGLCPQCGHDLNQGPCGCPQQEIDPRWAKLRELQATLASKEKRKRTSKR